MSPLRRILHRNGASAVALLGLIAIATAVALHILDNQRLRLPFLDEPAFEVHAEFATAQAVTPGQGQTITVAGVRIGDVADVRLREGRALVTFEIDERHRGVLRRDAELLLRPRTGLKDMFVEAVPGDGPALGPGETLPISQSLPDVNPEEFLATLDADTRDAVELLLRGAGGGLEGRGGDLAEALRRLQPTHRSLRRVTGAVARRERNLRRLTSRLERINTTLARDDDQVARLIEASSDVFGALASQEQGIRASLRAFPGALQATEDALGRVGRLGRVLEPAADRLRPAVRRLTRTNAELAPAARAIAPLLRDDVRPLIREARPLVQELGRASGSLRGTAPPLTRATVVLNHLFNMIGFNLDGREGPEDADRDEGYLFWSSWLAHNSNVLFGSGDAHGSLRPIAFASLCNTIENRVKEEPELEFLLGLTSALTSPAVCG